VRCRTVRGRAAQGQESRGRSGSARSDGWRGVGQVAWAGRACGVDRLGARGSVGTLGPGDGPHQLR
jgi:hypothetical protein